MSDNTKYDIINMRQQIKNAQIKINEQLQQGKSKIEIEMYFLNNESQLYDKYPYLIKKLIKSDPLDFLEVMLNNLQKVEEGDQTIASTELKLGKELADKYIYPSINNDD
jgi:hypothetical protein